MKAASFQYARPGTVDGACALLAQYGGDARVLAGGQSLLASLNLRLSAPELLVDINRIAALRGIDVSADGRHLRIGALVRHAETAASPLVARHAPLLRLAMRHVAHPAVRNRGTTCGSLALADPAAEMPACAMALEAVLVLRSLRGGVRHVSARDYFRGWYGTARADDELLVEVLYPLRGAGEVCGFDELSRRHGDLAMAGVAVRARLRAGRIGDLRLTTFATDPAPVVSRAAAALAEGRPWSAALGAAIADAAAMELAPVDNDFGSPAVRRLQARALIRRVLSATFNPAEQPGACLE